MKTAVFLVALAVPSMAMAQTARVKTGDHPGFTRIVIDLPAAGTWRLGRTASGYEFMLDGGPVPYNLTDVFRVISKDRLSAIWADPQTGNLRIGVACACHAVPFNFRSDIIVIDLRDGPPEAGSEFEQGLDGGQFPVLVAKPVPPLRPRPAPNRPVPPLADANRLALIRPVPRPLSPQDASAADRGDGLDLFPPAGTDQTAAAGPAVPFGLSGSEPSPGVQALRGELLQQLGRAATAGVIDVDKPVFPAAGEPVPEADVAAGASAHMAIAGIAGILAAPANTADPALTPEGAACLPDAELDIGAWGDGRPFDLQMSDARKNLLGEFDRPDPEHLARLIQLNLFFGFGAEARNILNSFGTEFPRSSVWTAMAHVLDDQAVVRDNPFSGQMACDGAVALWATLAEPVLTPASQPNVAGVSLTFSALPLHLRRHLGPSLAEKMLSVGDIATAQKIRDAIRRAPGDAGPDASLLDAELARERGDLAGATDQLSLLRDSGGGTKARAVIALVETRLAMGQPVDEKTLVELGALVHENQGTAQEAPLLRAETLALASSGNFDAAFDRIPDVGPDTEAGLWALLAGAGQDAPLLDHAVLPGETPVPDIPAGVRRQIAGRLLGLGFADQALRWLPNDTEEATLAVMAAAELQRGDARAALRGIAGLTSPEFTRLRAEALAQLDEQAAAARAFAEAGDPAAEAAALWRAQDWSASAQLGSEPIQAALQRLSPDAQILPPSGNAPLTSGRAQVEESAKAREAILSLLEATPMPASAQP